MAHASQWDVLPLHVGQCRLSKKFLYDASYSDDERVPIALYAFLARCRNRRILVDLGPKSLDCLNEMFRHYGFFRPAANGAPGPDDIAQPHGNILDQLRAHGVAPEQIDLVLFTHLHADHHGFDTPATAGACLDFPNAVFQCSAIGWRHNLDARDNGRWATYLDHAFGDFLLACERDGRLIASDDQTVLPGIRTVYLGGHAPCSQAVMIDTAWGPAVIGSDEFFRWDLLEQGVLGPIYTTPHRLADAVERAVHLVEQTAAILLPVHDPAVWELYQRHDKAWLPAARTRTMQAIAGYRARPPLLSGKPLSAYRQIVAIP